MASSDFTPQDGVGKDYKVGYGRPPKSHQFKKGQSGNPKGRPKYPTTIKEALVRNLSKKVTITEDGVHKRVIVLDVFVRQFVKEMLKCNMKAVEIFMKDFSNINLTDILFPREPEVLSKEEEDAQNNAIAALKHILDERYHGPNDKNS